PEQYVSGAKIPAVLLCHGFAGIKDFLLPAYAEAFAAAGFAALTFDYRGFGASEGERGRLNPTEQIIDIRNAITFLQTLPEVDPERIGLWGSSFGGANIIGTAAIDHRPRCLVAQLTFADGERMILGKLEAGEREKIVNTLKKASERQVLKNKTLSLTPDQILTDAESKDFFKKALETYPALQTKIPLLTLQWIIEFHPEELIRKIKRPILIISAENDLVCPAAESERLYEQANQPKELMVLKNTKHYDVYSGAPFSQSSRKAVDWFQRYL
ncbi:MAG TPA: alpha/beta fold hydrolase, partial [Bacillota bacterium]|nr:alpha/beta fold hydrolase [Bacillota bacterium]